MPLDFDALFAPFRTAYFLQWRSIGESLHKVAEWLTRRVKQTQERELATRAFQVFDFTGSALSVRIGSAQHGQLGPQGAPPPSGPLETAAAPFTAFWRGLLLAPAMIDAELALPGLLGSTVQFINLIVASLDRFTMPDKGLFDLTAGKHWDDLFGELALFIHIAKDPATVKQVQTFGAGGIEILRVLGKHFPPQPATGAQRGGLADLSRWVLGATLAIPLAGQLAAHFARTAGVVARFRLIDWASSTLNQVFALRREAIDFLYVTLFDLGRRALEWVVVGQSDVDTVLRLYIRFLSEYFKQVKSWLTTTGTDLKTYVDGVVTFLYGLGQYLESFMDIDFGGAVSFGFIEFKLNDILEWRLHPELAKEKQDHIDQLLSDRPILTALVRERLLALREVIGIAGTKTPFPDEAKPPDLSGIRAPQIYDAFFGGGRADKLRQSLAGIGPTLNEQLGSIFDAGSKALTDLSDTTHAAAATAVSLGSAARYSNVAQGATKISETVFDPEVAGVKAVPTTDPVAAAFGYWLAGSGFQVLEKALPSYVTEMIQFWKKEASKPQAERPTSPHILARRAEVERVRTPRMVIRVEEGRELDRGLAAEIGERVRAEVAKAFDLGMAQPATAG
jgi:hypothetical protein